MNSVGELLDKLSIAKIKYDKTQSSKIAEYIEYLKRELDNRLVDIENGKQLYQEPRFKVYSGKKEIPIKASTIEEAVLKLFKANKIIWDLEDKRRQKTISAKEIVEINKKSNKYNCIRNNMITEVDRLCGSDYP